MPGIIHGGGWEGRLTGQKTLLLAGEDVTVPWLFLFLQFSFDAAYIASSAQHCDPTVDLIPERYQVFHILYPHFVKIKPEKSTIKTNLLH